jgi:hypothetical protein
MVGIEHPLPLRALPPLDEKIDRQISGNIEQQKQFNVMIRAVQTTRS